MTTTKDSACKTQRETPCMSIISSSTTGMKPTSKSLKTRQKPSKTNSISVGEKSHTPVSEEDTSRQQIICVTPPGDCIAPISRIPVRKKKKTKSKTKHLKMMKIPSSDDKDTKIPVSFPTNGNIISHDDVTCPVVADSSALVPVNMGSSWKEN